MKPCLRHVVLWLALLVAACGTLPPVEAPQPRPVAWSATADSGEVLARSERFIIYVPGRGDTLRSIAARFLGSEDQHWVIGDFNGITRPEPGQTMVVPLKQLNPLGVYGDSYQTVPILCYHRFGAGGGKMVVSSANFAAQLDWLERNNYQVIRLSRLIDYLEGRQALPRRSVVLTIDDGYESAYRLAFPLLRKYGMPSTLFVYTDFIGGRDALSWGQLRELTASGLVDVQAHSKTHRNLIERPVGESDERYRIGLEQEVRAPRDLLERQLQVRVRDYAFPYGDANEMVLDVLTQQQYRLAVTVNPGGNAFFSQPLMLRRTMIYGDHDLEAFKSRLQISRPVAAP
jgi:peptidoglycan/xylan/chitin deacetylase (PgdA/CDA1 family)